MVAELCVDVIRVRASPFWPAQIEQTYLGGAERRRLFRPRFDEMLRDCQVRGLKPVIRPDAHPEVVALLRSAQARAKKIGARQGRGVSEAALADLRRLAGEFRRAAEEKGTKR